ncbi:MAG TPA: hypothetical protein VGK99_21415 [Acidobacteriota bacterium]|jgi:hypothetical protein
MKYFHIDYSHLKKWYLDLLPPADCDLLCSIAAHPQNRFVFSSTLVAEIVQQQDVKKALDIGTFLAKLPYVWFRDAWDLVERELDCALAAFEKNRAMQATPFVPDYRDTLQGIDDLDFYMWLNGRSIGEIVQLFLEKHAVHKKLITQHKQEERRIGERGQLDRELVLKATPKARFRDEAISNLTRSRVRSVDRLCTDDPRRRMTEQLQGHPEWAPAFWLMFHTRLEWFRNRNHRLDSSVIGDLTQLAAAPYVNGFVGDSHTVDYALRAIRRIAEPSDIRRRLIETIFSSVSGLNNKT